MDPAKAGGSAHQNGDSQGPHTASRGVSNVPRVRKLKVEDALTYLDQVKLQFQSRPIVYSDFLDIMKDFKSQAIDTPGVIKRVSRLFQGRPNLILGFNTFLPQGFVIRVQNDSSILIEHPDGTKQSVNENEDVEMDERPESEMLHEINGDQQQADDAMSDSKDDIPGGHSDTAEDASPDAPAELDLESAAARSQESSPSTTQFDYAVVYVNKIKKRFEGKPEVYQTFLQVLHAHQKNSSSEESSEVASSEGEVYKRVAKLFQNEPDLIEEFGSFLTSQSNRNAEAAAAAPSKKRPLDDDDNEEDATPEKKARLEWTVNYNTYRSDIVKFASNEDVMFFDKVQGVMSREGFQNFLRLLILYNRNVVSRSELVDLTLKFFNEHSELKKEFKTMINQAEQKDPMEEAFNALRQRSMPPPDQKPSVDYASCKRFGVSYRSIPDGYQVAHCTGRTDLCKKVLNDVWVSFPSWSSEDTSNVSSKKTAHEEFIYRTEEERYELDIVLEVNKSAIDLLSLIDAKMKRMKPDDLAKLRFDDKFGGKSSSLMRRALKRLYGEHANKMLEGLMYAPSVAVPRVLTRMREKHREWMEALKQFNRVWRDQIDKNYNKSLDHQATALKSSDVKMLKSKSLVHHIENLYDERMAQLDESNPGVSADPNGPHMCLIYGKDRSVIYDVNDMLIHHVKRLPNLPKEEKQLVKLHIKKTLLEMFGLEAQQLSDDEETTAAEEDVGDKSEADGKRRPVRKSIAERNKGQKKAKNSAKAANHAQKHHKAAKSSSSTAFRYRLFFGSNIWYSFMRVHHILVDRLTILKKETMKMTTEYEDALKTRAEQERIYQQFGTDPGSHEMNAADTNRGLLLLKPPLESPKPYYSKVIDSVKNLLDGQMEGALFEDSMRSMFETRAYLAFTMDKLIVQLGKYLQQIVNDQVNTSCFELYQKMSPSRPRLFVDNRKRKKNRHPVVASCEQDQKYQTAAEHLLRNQNCYKMYYLNATSPVVSVELINTDVDSDDEDEEEEEVSSSVNDQIPTVSGVGADEETKGKVSNRRSYNREYVNEQQHNFDVKSMERSRFLARNRRNTRTFKSFKDEKPMIVEGLQAVIEDDKLHYVANTCDLFYRKQGRSRGKAKHQALATRKLKVSRRWLEQIVKRNKDASWHNWLQDGSKCTKVRSSQRPFAAHNVYKTSPK